MSGNFDHLSNSELADKLSGYNLYATSRGSDIPGPTMLALIRKRLRELEKFVQQQQQTNDNNTILTPLGERLIEKE